MNESDRLMYRTLAIVVCLVCTAYSLLRFTFSLGDGNPIVSLIWSIVCGINIGLSAWAIVGKTKSKDSE